MITSLASFPLLNAPVTPTGLASGLAHGARAGSRLIAAATLAILTSTLLAGGVLALVGYRSVIGLVAGDDTLLPLVGSTSFLALDALVVARAGRPAARRSGVAGGTGVRFVGCDAAELVARGQVVLAHDGPNVAGYLFDRAIAADPTCEEAWLLKAACLADAAERLTCLQAGLNANPSASQLEEAVAHAVSLERVR